MVLKTNEGFQWFSSSDGMYTNCRLFSSWRKNNIIAWWGPWVALLRSTVSLQTRPTCLVENCGLKLKFEDLLLEPLGFLVLFIFFPLYWTLLQIQKNIIYDWFSLKTTLRRLLVGWWPLKPIIFLYSGASGDGLDFAAVTPSSSRVLGRAWCHCISVSVGHGGCFGSDCACVGGLAIGTHLYQSSLMPKNLIRAI